MLEILAIVRVLFSCANRHRAVMTGMAKNCNMSERFVTFYSTIG